MGEFLCSHFNTEDGRKYAPFLAHYALLFQEGKNATKTQKETCAVHGEGAATDRTCQKRFAKVRAGGFSLDEAPRSEVTAIQSRRSLRTANPLPRGGEPPYSKYPNQSIGEMKNVSHFTGKTLKRTFWPPTVTNSYNVSKNVQRI